MNQSLSKALHLLNYIKSLNFTNKLELRFNNKIKDRTIYKYIKNAYSRYTNSDRSYWDIISELILEAALDNGQKSFFRNQIVIDHLASFDPRLGYCLLDYISEQPNGINVLNKCQTPPWGSPFLLERFPTHSTTTLSHISNLCEIEQKFQKPIGNFSKIIDFGGGYGGLARCLLLLNSSMKVTILDSKPMIDVQQVFLEETLCNIDRVNFATSLSKLEEEEYDLFNATFSLSETPNHIRDRAIKFATSNCKNLFIVFQHYFGTYQNLEYFSIFRESMEKSNWKVSIERYGPYGTRDDVSVLYASNLDLI